MKSDSVKHLLAHLTPDELAELDSLLTVGKVWMPLPGPQAVAYDSRADVIGYGGSAGGGKTDLALGMALTKHTVSAIFRREATQLHGIIERLAELRQGRDGYNGSEKIWRLGDGKRIEFGSAPNAGDETRYQGRPKDLLVIDEATNFLEQQVRFLMGWVRTTIPGQHCQTLMTFNPPTNADGQWIIAFFAPWLDRTHPNPAQAGEVRWFASLDGRDVELTSPEPFSHNGELIKPQSRTFIPSRITDNPYLMGTGYMATLQSLPEPLRSQMLHGDFTAGLEDDAYQVIPSAWVIAAQDRWQPRDVSGKGPMDSMGVDVARGGRDETVIVRRHGAWFDELVTHPGSASPDGPSVAAQVLAVRRDAAPVHIDVVGWGASPFDFLLSNGVQTLGINGASKSHGTSREGGLRFVNRRAEVWWRLREALDPLSPQPLALPKDPRLRADLCAPKWTLGTGGIQIESKDDIIARLGRSPDRGDAVALALISTLKDNVRASAPAFAVGADYDPFGGQ
ncbi:terminase [Insolitispirillum peregrinum]|uniref:Terminase-like family protein n=1 Tax=Insolitispirillum peregrinum TaxID=80876 RepID=A0A1N7LFX2_9PROT|nr:terminase [Insolitispirillum peregrinum]SIS72703.1 hypothetical protein SAMN05421779_103304 [Insolitispirillum peregrinum]